MATGLYAAQAATALGGRDDSGVNTTNRLPVRKWSVGLGSGGGSVEGTPRLSFPDQIHIH